MHSRSCRIIAFFLIFTMFLSLSPLVFAQEVEINISSASKERGDVSVSSFKVESGGEVTIQAIPKSGYRFDHWELVSGRLSFNDTVAQQVISPTGNIELKAHFVPDVYTVTVTMDDQEGGSFTFYEKEFAPGEEVSITVKPYEGFTFTKWESEDVNLGGGKTDLTLKFTMPARNVKLIAFFDLIRYRFKVIAGPGGRVTVQGHTPDSDGQYECGYGEEIELFAEPDENYLFSGWTCSNGAQVTSAESDSTTLLCPASDFTVRAQFASSIRDLTVTSTEGGSVSPQEGKMRLGSDNILELLAVPDDGYVFSYWECSSEDGRFTNPKNESTVFTMPDENCTVTAVFIKGGYRLTLIPTMGGKVNDAAAGNYEINEQVPVIATPEAGYEFVRWECDVKGVIWDSTSAETVVTIPGQDVKVTAIFALIGGNAKKTDTTNKKAGDSGSGFPWAALIIVLFLSGVAIALIVIRERFNLSYRYLIRKWFKRLSEGEDDEE